MCVLHTQFVSGSQCVQVYGARPEAETEPKFYLCFCTHPPACEPYDSRVSTIATPQTAKSPTLGPTRPYSRDPRFSPTPGRAQVGALC